MYFNLYRACFPVKTNQNNVKGRKTVFKQHFTHHFISKKSIIVQSLRTFHVSIERKEKFHRNPFSLFPVKANK